MAKRHFLQQAHNHIPTKHPVVGQLMSEKLDGMRCFWDGGVSRGKLATDVPWANTAKDTKPIICTGLWSRYGKTIQAPAWWLDNLPSFPLDGELHAGRGNFQQTMSYARKHTPVDSEWQKLVFNVFDSPCLSHILYDSHIKQGSYDKELVSCQDFVTPALWNHRNPEAPYSTIYDYLITSLPKLDTLALVSQIKLASEAQLDKFISKVAKLGGEGVILRNPSASYVAERSHSITKLKPFFDSEATVTGYITGRETDRGSKLRGLMGALILNFQGQRLELSGFTDSERELVSQLGSGFNWAWDNPETQCPSYIEAKHFPVGSKVTFRYRELSDTGIPKEARYLRPYSEA